MLKVHTRRLRDDENTGLTREVVVVTRNGQVVNDDRNGTTILDADGRKVAFVPMSARAIANDAAWLGRVQAAA